MNIVELAKMRKMFGGSGGGSGGGSSEKWIEDGNTHLWITLEEGRTSPMLGVCPNGTVTVDWGDGTTPDVLTGTSISSVKWTPTHNYAEPGDYVITLTVEGTMGFYGTSTTDEHSGILRYSNGADSRNLVYQNAVYRVEIGNSVTSIGIYAFASCYSLENVVISGSVTSIGVNGFSYCYSLENVVIPDSVTSIGNSAFTSCYSLKNVVISGSVKSIGSRVFEACRSLENVVIPDSVTSIDSNAFSNCRSLANVVISGSVTSIGGNAFGWCSGVRYYDFTNHAAVPTLSATTSFNNISADCEFCVPEALYDEWIAATNWTTYADKIVAG